MEILAVENLSFAYPQCPTPAVSDVSFSAVRGDLIALCGATGSGKSTLLRMLKPEITPLGEISGTIRFCGIPLNSLTARDCAAKIGFVMQKPEQQIVTDKVWHELAFGLENLGIAQDVIARRVAEMASYFGISDWYDRDVSTLSGGQKQLLNLASVMVMQPDILILDEPTAQLDPIAAADFITTLKKLNEDFALTILICEHRLEEIIPLCDKLMVLEQGHLLHYGDPRTVIAKLRDKPALLCAMPAAARLCAQLDDFSETPLTVREGRKFLEANYTNKIRELTAPAYTHANERAVEFQNVYFRYGRALPDVLQNLNLTVYAQEIFCILGGNGSGKSTALHAAAGILKPHSGSIRILGKRIKDYKNQSLYQNCLAALPQDVQTVFLENTVREELADNAETELPFDIRHLYDKHPYDLSGGEQQLAALAKILAHKPKILLLDEPTKGLDAHTKSRFIDILKKLKVQGMTIIIVTHDVELAALCADRCAMFFRGSVVSVDAPQKFFSENSFYTTAASRMTRGFFDNAVTVEDAAALCLKNGTRGADDEK
ncbi:MAG: ATP-binding cassette domain-containing protein [Ruminococcus sp.]|nr:ATP-binding cassette domain-containing protein [Ruminococcus sp.]